MYRHGGDIYEQEVEYDFSVNVNPLGMPERVLRFLGSDRALYYAGIYPQNGNGMLSAVIAEKEGVAVERVVCGNGASELIYAVFAALKPQNVLLCSPTFSEYGQAAAICGCDIIYYETKESSQFRVQEDFLRQMETEKPALIVLCNPSNPVGSCIMPELMDKIVYTAGQFGACLLVDECFLPFLKEHETLSAKRYLERIPVFHNDAAHNPAHISDGVRVGTPSVIVLRAFTKFYAMPGLRLGYLITSDGELSDKVRSVLPDWNVSSIAQQAGMLALTETEYENRTRDFLQTEREYMRTGLVRLGATVYDGCANYLFWKGKAGLKERLVQSGILIRDCSNYHGLAQTEDGMCYYRTAIRLRAENDRLLELLGCYL